MFFFKCKCGKMVESKNPFNKNKSWCFDCKYGRKLERARNERSRIKQ